MPIPVINFQPDSFQAANPMLSGMQMGNQLIAQNIQNQFMAPMMQQQLQRALLQNQIMQPQAQMAPQITAADLAVKQAQPGLMGAQAGLYGAEAGKDREATQLMPITTASQSGPIGQILAAQKLAQIFGLTSPDNGNTVQVGSPNGQPQQQGGQPQSFPGVPWRLPTQQSQQPQQGINVATSQDPASYPVIGGGLPSGVANNITQQLNTGPQGNGSLTPNWNDLFNLGKQSALAGFQNNISRAQLTQQKTTPYDNLTTTQKDAVLAQASGMGYSPDDAANLLTQGKSIEDLAIAKGFDPKNMPDPIYAPTKGSLTQIQKRQQALNEINKIEPLVTSAVAPYAQRFSGYSPSQIADAISNDDPEKQAQYLAGMALQPEMAALRMRAMNGQVGIEAIREIQAASLGHIKVLGGLVNPDVYKRSQDIAYQWIQQAADSANKIGIRSIGTGGSQAPTGEAGQATDLSSSGTMPEGATKAINGQNYIKRNGQWYAQ